MMLSVNRLKAWLQSDWVIAFVIFAIFLLTNGYTYGWDDQHLEIPLLKGLIDPSLYVGDYYVGSLKKNFTSFLYPILARFITLEQIPTVYFIFYLISRYFLFFFQYKIWHLISQNRLSSVLCVLMIILIGRVEEFLYRTFSHQELALSLIFAGMYLFYKDRFVWAAVILSIATNFHALYSAFPMIYMLGYLACHRRKHGVKTLLKSLGAYLLFLMPLLVWAFQKYQAHAFLKNPGANQDWLSLFLLACPQNFLFYIYSLRDMLSQAKIFFTATKHYWILITLVFLNYFHNQKFRNDEKGKCIVHMGFGLLIFSFIFSYIFPQRFILDLNLVRNTQYMLFILMGYTTLLMIEHVTNNRWYLFLPILVIFPLLRFQDYIATLSGLSLLLFLSLITNLKTRGKGKIFFSTLCGAGLILCLGGIIGLFHIRRFSTTSLLGLWIYYVLIGLAIILFWFIKNAKVQGSLRKFLIMLPFIIFTVNYMIYHKYHLRIEKYGAGFWQLQRNWIDMQNYVRQHTHKNALLLVPHDMEMGGFRIFSERKIICCYRDCGIIGFDYEAAKEWQRRLSDIESFKVLIDKPFTEAILKAIFKYRVNYIVFMKYADPGNNSLWEAVYQNEAFVLYKVLLNPI